MPTRPGTHPVSAEWFRMGVWELDGTRLEPARRRSWDCNRKARDWQRWPHDAPGAPSWVVPLFGSPSQPRIGHLQEVAAFLLRHRVGRGNGVQRPEPIIRLAFQFSE